MYSKDTNTFKGEALGEFIFVSCPKKVIRIAHYRIYFIKLLMHSPRFIQANGLLLDMSLLSEPLNQTLKAFLLPCLIFNYVKYGHWVVQFIALWNSGSKTYLWFQNKRPVANSFKQVLLKIFEIFFFYMLNIDLFLFLL